MITASSPEIKRPKYKLLAEQIRRQITSGELQPGYKLPTFVELRRNFGATPTTATRVYELLEQEGLIERSQGSGVYVAHPKARTRTGQIAFILYRKMQQHPYYMHLLAGVREQADAAGVELLLLSEETTVRWEKVDGVIYQATTHSSMSLPPGMPQVSLIHPVGEIPSAVSDDYVGMQEAMNHLKELGHRRIAFLTSEPRAMTLRRGDAYRAALQARGIEPNPTWQRALSDPGETGKAWEVLGYQDMRAWLDEDWRSLGCSALLAQNDETAVGIIQALQESGLKVPGDVSVVGFDGTEIASFHRPRLTTVKVPLRDIGAMGFRLLMQQMEAGYGVGSAPRLSNPVVLPSKLMVGETTGAAKKSKGR